MNKKAVVNFLQNITMVTLTVTALFLLTRFPMWDGIWSGKVRALLTTPEKTVQRSLDLTTAITTVHFAVTDDSEYGRYTEINAATDSTEFQTFFPLFRAAVGSAVTGRSATQDELRLALKTPSIFVDFTTVLPMQVVAAWFGETYGGEENVRAIALTTDGETALLFFVLDDSSILRFECALTSSAVREVTTSFSPNAGQFAFESEHDSLTPYTILVQQVRSAAQVNAAIPAGYSAYNLLTALDFNAHTNARYTESSGTEVIMQTPRVLRIGTDGTVHYSGDGEVTNELYRIACEGALPSAAEAVRGACILAAALHDGTDAASFSLDSVQKTETGWIVSFCYRVDRVRVRLSDDRAALRVVINRDTITEFEYYCRAYTPTQENTVLLPPSMAVAIASMYENAELMLAYMDRGASLISAHWFAQ